MDRAPHAVKTELLTDLDSVKLADLLNRHLHFSLGKDEHTATPHDQYVALVYAIREYLLSQWFHTQQRYYHEDRKRVYYLSMEFLTGRTLSSALVNLGLLDITRESLVSLGLDLDDIISMEWEAGLGNGGLGRLAACLLDSMATLGLAAYGYGLRYEYGIFQQRIQDGYQFESPDNWLRTGNPWEIERPEDLYPIGFYGEVREYRDADGVNRYEWITSTDVMAMAYDVPVPGYQNGVVNTLRLWSAKSSHAFNFDQFNRGDYVSAVEEKDRTESITRVLYPNDNFWEGKELRLKQEYFLVSAAIQDIIRRYRKTHETFDDFPDKVAIQLNDTHPSLVIPELMRVLMDEERLEWDHAWDICTNTCAYTNHTLLPEALEQWSVEMLGRVLPRHLQIIYEINHHFLADVSDRYPGDDDRLQRMSLVNEDEGKSIRMSHLAVVGSHTVNGVSRLHTDLLRSRLFRDFDEFYPWKFVSTTNGITPRRWLRVANPPLADLLQRHLKIGAGPELVSLEGLTAFAHDPAFAAEWSQAKRLAKQRLVEYVRRQMDMEINLESMFDCQVKRIHEYKRQLMNVLHVIAMYHQLKDGNASEFTPRTVIISGKAAPGYKTAKAIIKLIHSVADRVNNDPMIGNRLKLVFLPNYSVSLAEIVIPAADLSEQISTAGTEASGTGNMKFALNGALTIATLDGANIEIAEAVGMENMFTFGMNADEVEDFRRAGYSPYELYRHDMHLRPAIDAIRDGDFSPHHSDLFRPLIDSLLQAGDPYLVLADFADYLQCQQRVAAAFRDQAAWVTKSILNVAQMGRFSSDRTAMVYARDVWGVDSQIDGSVADQLKTCDRSLRRPSPRIR